MHWTVARSPAISARRDKRRRCTSRGELPPPWLPHSEVEIYPSRSRWAEDHCRKRLADLPFAIARAGDFAMEYRVGADRRRDADALAARHGCERQLLERLGQTSRTPALINPRS